MHSLLKTTKTVDHHQGRTQRRLWCTSLRRPPPPLVQRHQRHSSRSRKCLLLLLRSSLQAQAWARARCVSAPRSSCLPVLPPCLQAAVAVQVPYKRNSSSFRSWFLSNQALHQRRPCSSAWDPRKLAATSCLVLAVCPLDLPSLFLARQASHGSLHRTATSPSAPMARLWCRKLSVAALVPLQWVAFPLHPAAPPPCLVRRLHLAHRHHLVRRH